MGNRADMWAAALQEVFLADNRADISEVVHLADMRAGIAVVDKADNTAGNKVDSKGVAPQDNRVDGKYCRSGMDCTAGTDCMAGSRNRAAADNPEADNPEADILAVPPAAGLAGLPQMAELCQAEGQSLPVELVLPAAA